MENEYEGRLDPEHCTRAVALHGPRFLEAAQPLVHWHEPGSRPHVANNSCYVVLRGHREPNHVSLISKSLEKTRTSPRLLTKLTSELFCGISYEFRTGCICVPLQLMRLRFALCGSHASFRSVGIPSCLSPFLKFALSSFYQFRN
jgi:hypothetical protein